MKFSSGAYNASGNITSVNAQQLQLISKYLLRKLATSLYMHVTLALSAKGAAQQRDGGLYHEADGIGE